MIVEDGKIDLATALLKLEQDKLTQNDKAVISSYVNNDINKMLDVFDRVIDIFQANDQPAPDKIKAIFAKYKALGFDKILSAKWLKGFVEYALTTKQKTPDERLASLKKLFDSNVNCPEKDIRNGINLSILRFMTLVNSVSKDREFSTKVLAAVVETTLEEKVKARVPNITL